MTTLPAPPDHRPYVPMHEPGHEIQQCHVTRSDVRNSYRACCADGHYSPEEAASHGASAAVGLLCADVRAMRPPQSGAVVLARTA